ncbi:MAG: hypothetical protein QNK05_08050 [Myxococcota bacterium]|nr:hypothetical protein [Myxococcota bacterium]
MSPMNSNRRNQRNGRTLRRCMVCGSSEVRTDEVVDLGVLLLSECPRCDHRWTERPVVRVTHGLASEEQLTAA